MNLKLVTILIIFSLIACKKDKLPKATQEGANTFGCRIDGVVFKPFYRGGLFNDVKVLTAGNSQNLNIFGISARNQETDQSVYIEFTYITGPGTYQLRQYPYRGIYNAGVRNPNPGGYSTDSVNTGELVITRCDNINKIYSGTFSFTCKGNAGKIVRITDGRFDVSN